MLSVPSLPHPPRPVLSQVWTTVSGVRAGVFIWGLGMDGNSKKRARPHCLWRKGPQFAPQRFPEAFLWVGIDFTRVSPLPSPLPAAAQVAEICPKDAFQS